MSTRFARAVSQVGNRSGAPVAEALALLVANEPEGALRWGAAALERDPSAPLALIVTSRALARIGRTRAAIDGLVFAVERAIDAQEPFLALVAIDDLRALGVGVTNHLDRVAAAFCETSSSPLASYVPIAEGGEIDALSSLLRGPALASKATQIVYEAVGIEQPTPTPFPLFGGLSESALRELIEAFDVVTVPAGHCLIDEGYENDAGYLVACGELEITRHEREGSDKKPMVLARLGSGAFFGEMALLADLPAASSVVAKRSSILLVIRRDVLEAIAARHVDVAFEIAAHCRRSAVANLGRSSPVMGAVPAPERSVLVERLELRVFAHGERLVREGEEAPGLHLVVSGEVSVIARDGDDRVVLETLTAGATLGEVELVLCRDANADVIAVKDTATLFLPRDDFFALAEDHPSIVHGMYAIAVRRHLETKEALESGSATVGDDCVFQDVGLAVLAEPRRSRAPEPSIPPVLPAQSRPARVSRPPAPVLSARAIVDPVPTTERAGVRESVAAIAVGAAAAAGASIPPITKSHPPARPSSPGLGSLARISLQGAAAVAVAASVAAVFTTRDRQPAMVTTSAGSRALPLGVASPAFTPTATLPPVTLWSITSPSVDASAPLAIVAPSPGQTKAFLTSALPKPRAKIATPRFVAPPFVAPPPDADEPAAPKTPDEPRAASKGEEEFGGRE
jgi:CRP-like cAMP-binding protein